LIINKKVSFYIGWFSFNKVINLNWNRNDFHIFFSQRILNEWIWYFWRFNSQILNNNLYKGPGFYINYYNYYFSPNIENNFYVDMVDFSWLESTYFYINYFLEIEFLNFFNLDFSKNDNLYLKQKRVDSLYWNLYTKTNLLFNFLEKRYNVLCLFDKRFDLVRASFRFISLLRINFYLKWLKLVKFLLIFLKIKINKFVDINWNKKLLLIWRCINFLLRKIKKNKRSKI
jgi:hypothetical protein